MILKMPEPLIILGVEGRLFNRFSWHDSKLEHIMMALTERIEYLKGDDEDLQAQLIKS